MIKKYTEKDMKKLEISKIMINLKNLFYVEKEIKNIMIKLYLKILKKIILLILNEFYNTII